ncbi:hypothetical protein PRIPAC_82799 [Pristionchus pacificus]|uniref:Uncharacterized protein n=1 Tax=Pristionchus pacificus TaxID=54126 RepID=A0A2A6CP48_PRIPA|nr:hypothetical protein PRIPAC_82799 [Pristionchus pacificus]|eukprot:PDM79878.1 hypothetical protein PRIPAC_32457 [Pristionchus pacificus]
MAAWHDRFLTPRVCCCSATVASQVCAVLSLVQCGFFGVWFWFPVTKFLLIVPLYYQIDQTVMAILSLVACALVFIGSCARKPILIIPAIVLQAIITINLIVTFTIFLTWVFPFYDIWGILFWLFFYMVILYLNLIAFVYHAGCFKLVRNEAILALRSTHQDF